jgi:EAL domain-containing protein (putative c-di-GMP-specific phosphodiesterase class I)
MADALGIDTVAEGVERPQEASSLAELGCTAAQGYLYGAPGPLYTRPAMLPTQRQATSESATAPGR